MPCSEFVTKSQSSIQINPNTEKLRPEEAHRSLIPRAAWQMTCQPALALTRIVVGEQVRGARVPVIL
jgi:hypothetical protein